ncbi:MAG TPA: trehalase-like domain-containing protein, partial [Polyangia bacterium]
MRLEDLGLVGNCQFSALIERSGAVVWCCLPRFDSEPVFSTLLDEKDGGKFVVGPADGGMGSQRYLENSNVLETTFRTDQGSFRVVDLAPRFPVHDQMFRPTQLVRIVEPIDGTPRIRVDCDPRLGWSKAVPTHLSGSSHVQFEGFGNPLRLTTDIPPTYLEAGQSFTLSRRQHLILDWGAPIEEPLAPLATRYLNET